MNNYLKHFTDKIYFIIRLFILKTTFDQTAYSSEAIKMFLLIQLLFSFQ